MRPGEYYRHCVAPVRVRGCAGHSAPNAGRRPRQADASRRRNGPRKATYRRLITVRLRGKSCPLPGIGYPSSGEKGISGTSRAARPSAGGCGVEDQVGRTGATSTRWKGAQVMEIIFKGRQTDVATRFRDQATAKLMKLEKLDQKAIRVDVEVSVERNPRQASQKERVELTILSRGPAIRAEAAAEDRFAALDM